uniref:CUZD1 protein n=1 Tax=Varanus komodoensis TaxID=61221 RepID=A0A8D2JAC3_VARKO
GPSTNASLLGRVCNNHNSVPVFQSSFGSITFRISTDSTAFTRSIFAFYYFITPQLANIKNCGGFLTGPDGVFTSPNYPQSHPEFAYCVWHIQTEANSKINLTFNEIFLEIDQDCRFDFLAIYDGATTDSGLIKKVCGRTAPMFQSSSNVMTVVLSTDYANSYRGFSARYTSIPIPVGEPNTSLSCSSDMMTVTIRKAFMDSFGYNENDWSLIDPSCRPIALNPLVFHFPLKSCGTIKKSENNTISYINAVTASSKGAVITRKKDIEIVVKCIMENNSTAEVMYITERDIVQNTSSTGRYNLSMSFYESSSFSKPIVNYPYYVDLNQTLYVQVSLHSTDANLLVFVDTCTASPHSDLGSPKYELVRHGCAKDDTYGAYPVLEHYGRFRFSSFRFLQNDPSVYLRCEVLICDSTNTGTRCTQGCVSRKKREISSYKWKGDAIVGPIRLKRDHSSRLPQVHATHFNTQSNNLYLLTFAVLAMNVVLLAGLVAKHFISQKAGYRYQKLQSS